MNKSVDPCDDFYQFACGGFVNKTVFRPGESRLNTFSEIRNLLKNQLKTLLEMNPTSNDIKPFVMVRNFYQACINETAMEMVGLKPLQETILSLGGWLDTEDKSDVSTKGTKYNWTSDLKILREYGYSTNFIMEFHIFQDLNNHSKRILLIDTPGFGIYRDFLVKGRGDFEVEAYFKYMKDAAVFLGHNLTDVQENLQSILNFEIQMANLTKSIDERINITELYNRMQIKNLTQLNPCIPWIQYINSFLKITQVQKEDEIIVYEPAYISGLYRLMNKTSLKVVKDYVRWRFIESSLPELNKAAQNISNAFNDELSGTNGQKERDITCIEIVSDKLEHAVGAMYVRTFFKESSKENIKDMVESVRQVFYKILNNTNWLIKTDWVTNGGAAVVDAFNFITNNALVLPAGVLQGLFFSADRPNYLNLGTMGWIIGHEITHGFDSNGRQYTKDGVLENWWDNQTVTNFLNRSQCFVEQYGNYSIKNVNQTNNGKRTLHENIADNGGIRAAYQAFIEWKNNNTKSIELLPGLNFTSNQLFWLSGANMWCSKNLKKVEESLVLTDEHSLATARVDLSFSKS
ncbi:MMEL1 [Lepeophtheirus salmonis]|uniref:MMEL1 n=1 Tax=Lepeophtheirus salmonis TaxID=72036 RepID=A0A7R8CI39_LEPSM|nr:MMEL1 [Lepeophtheirus salmonis]CAF2823984.1 MMEL1 [Lepeophtheirus salmonis]